MPTLHILGANSFIGANVARYIRGLPNSDLSIALYGRNDLNLLNPELVSKFFSSIESSDPVLVAAAVSRLTDNSYQCFLENCQMAKNLATGIKEHASQSHLMYLSSIDVYGQKTQNITLSEQSTLAPDDYYACSKVAGESFLKIAFKHRPELLSIFRLTGIYGPNDKERSLVGLFTRRLLENKEITLFSGGTSLRDYVYVDDLAEIIYQSVQKKISGVFNIATGKSSSVREIAEFAQQIIRPNENQLTYSEEGDRNYDLVFNISKLQGAFPNVQFRSIERGISDYINNA